VTESGKAPSRVELYGSGIIEHNESDLQGHENGVSAHTVHTSKRHRAHREVIQIFRGLFRC